jgi:hypothetical protein
MFGGRLAESPDEWLPPLRLKAKLHAVQPARNNWPTHNVERSTLKAVGVQISSFVGSDTQTGRLTAECKQGPCVSASAGMRMREDSADTTVTDQRNMRSTPWSVAAARQVRAETFQCQASVLELNPAHTPPLSCMRSPSSPLVSVPCILHLLCTHRKGAVVPCAGGSSRCPYGCML